MQLEQFKLYLRSKGLSESTIQSYTYSVKIYLKNYTINFESLLEYRGYLLQRYKPKTVNLRIQGLNKYLIYTGREELKLKQIKVQQKTYLENVISHADYLYFKKCLKKDGNEKWYFIVWFLCATGARVGELVRIKVEHVKIGYIDIYAKGGKIRRLFIPKNLRDQVIKWLKKEDRTSGLLFRNRQQKTLSTNGVAQQLKYYAKKYGLNEQVVYPHSFRHLFAKNFISRSNDIALLADLMGHESIETTRIYLRKTMGEQRHIVDSIVDW